MRSTQPPAPTRAVPAYTVVKFGHVYAWDLATGQPYTRLERVAMFSRRPRLRTLADILLDLGINW